MKAFQDEVVGNVAKEFEKTVQSSAQNAREEYAQEFALSKVNSSDSMFLVHVGAKEVAVETTDDRSVFYYVPTSPYSVASRVTKVLLSAQPFTNEFVPYKPTGYYKLVFRKVSEDELIRVREKNELESPTVLAKIMSEGGNPAFLIKPKEMNPDLKVVEDVVWRVIRQELGIREKRIQVWLPAISSFKSGKILRKALKTAELDRLLIDASWREFAVDSTVSENYLDYFDRFQEHILNV